MAGIISARFPQRDSLLFVYGTLRPFVDIPMARWLTRAARYVGTCKTPGRPYDLGSFPGLRPARRTRKWVSGDVYEVRDPLVVRALDSYEAGARAGRPRFVRSACVVSVGRRGKLEAWVYLYRRNPSHRAHCRRLNVSRLCCASLFGDPLD
ncbi:MAG: gamma-glutamylcyclotransferase family protein [Gammaproteobacteria bacterium]